MNGDEYAALLRQTDEAADTLQTLAALVYGPSRTDDPLERLRIIPSLKVAVRKAEMALSKQLEADGYGPEELREVLEQAQGAIPGRDRWLSGR